MAEVKILIVDDSRTSKRILRNLLESQGYEVVAEAADGEEGFAKYQEVKPDLVTMDITMPKMDGIESLTLIKQFDPSAKVVMITAAGQKEKMVEALKRGADEFITKPFDPEEVSSIIKRLTQ